MKIEIMHIGDSILIIKKIIVGLILTVAPFLLFYGALWIVRHIF